MKGLELIGFPLGFYSVKFNQFECSAISDTNFMLYSLNTSKGSSGSPLLLPHKNEPYTVLAVHVRDVSNLVFTNNEKIKRRAALKLRADLL
jgi:V8-like Glu-specific endopeptidase